MQDNPITPVSAHIATPSPSTHVRPPRIRLRLDDLFPESSPLSRHRWRSVGLIAATAAVTAGLLLWLWGEGRIRSPVGSGGGTGSIPTQTESMTDTTHTDEPLTTTHETGEETDSTDSSPEPNSDTTDSADSNEPTSSPVDTEAEDASANETALNDDSSDQAEITPPPDALPEESATPLPDGCFAYVSQDMSESALGVGYIQNGGHALPSSLPTDSPWVTENPAVLIVHTHPYEGYGGDSPWYDSTMGGLALTNTPNDPRGVVALGAELAKYLRGQGLTVIHLRLPVTEDESTSAIFARTEEAIRYYRSLYPNIGLVVDLRRTAELTGDGSILATKGVYNGAPCAQLRISVNGGRNENSLCYDLAVALSIRESLWNREQTLSRPTRVKSGAGLSGDLDDLRVLTLEMGSAGNTYDEARPLVEPLGDAIYEAIKKYS